MRFCWWMPRPLIMGLHTRAICDRLTRAVEDWRRGISTFLLVAVPFRHGKSDIVSRALPAFFLGRNADRQPDVIMSGYGASLIRGFSRRAQRIMRSDRYKMLYPGVRPSGTIASWQVDGPAGTVTAVGLGGAPFSFVGYPTEHGVGSMFAQIGNAFAISASCPEKEAAWAFVRQFFLPAYQEQLSGNVFPTNLAVYEEMKREAQATSYQRNPDGSYALDAEGRRIEADRGSVEAAGQKVKLRASTAEEIALVEEIVAATTHVLSTDNSLKDLIVESAAPYFIDQRSVEDVVKQIQSRAFLYVNEQR